MPLYRYRCDQGHEAELLRPRDVAVVSCPCGAQADRLAVNRVAHIGRATVPRDERSYRQSYAEYHDAVQDVAYKYDRLNDSRAPAEKVREPDYYELAKAQAVAKGASIL